MTLPFPPTLRLGTRGSLLARAQSRLVADALEHAHAGLHVELVVIKTAGDQITDRPLHEMGGKGLFTRELEQALLAGQVHLAVHSFKDMPTTMPLVEQTELVVAAVPAREDPRDVLISSTARTIGNLPPGARVGTGSLRRRSQILAVRPDLCIEPVRGNIDTRLRKQREGQFDAIVLAMAGVRRAKLHDPSIMHPINSMILPAPGQGALALQCRKEYASTRGLLEALNDPDTSACVAAERALVALLEGDCLSPIAALASIQGDQLLLRARVGARGGWPPVLYAQGQSSRSDPRAAAEQAFRALESQGVKQHLHGTRDSVDARA